MNRVSGPSFHRILWKDFPMLNTSCFDYPGGEWDVDLSRLVGDPSVMLKIPSAEDFVPCSFDYKDLVITKELEIDPWAKVVEIARKIRCPIRDVSYHLNKHVLGRGLIDSFRIRWIGTQQAWAKHSIIGLTFVFNKIGDKDARHAISILTSVPFLWSHLRTDGGMYLAEILIPVSMFHETIQRISLQLVQVDLVPEILLPDWSCSSNYTIPYQLYDKTDKEWVLDGERIMANILEQHAIERRKA
jgi:hypothetical protein